MNKIIMQFICIQETKFSGKKDSIKIGDVFYGDFKQWKSSNLLELTEKPDEKWQRVFYGKSSCFIPMHKWREKQINSILTDD